MTHIVLQNTLLTEYKAVRKLITLVLADLRSKTKLMLCILRPTAEQVLTHRTALTLLLREAIAYSFAVPTIYVKVELYCYGQHCSGFSH